MFGKTTTLWQWNMDLVKMSSRKWGNFQPANPVKYGNSMGPAYHKQIPCPWESLDLKDIVYVQDGPERSYPSLGGGRYKWSAPVWMAPINGLIING